MSALVARSPLHPLDMSATQRPKRKAATRNALGDDEGLPLKKRSKVEIEPRSQTTESNGRPSRRKKQVYEEEVDGFAFRRKNTKAKQAKIAADTAPAELSLSRSRDSPAVPSAKVKPAPAPKEPRRRSARLSAESSSPRQQQVVHAQTTKQAPARGTKRRSNGKTGASDEAEESVETGAPHPGKIRSEGTTIVLPFADTPVIKRNKEMRAAHGKRNSSSNRRSSAGLRGRRASSLIDSGTSNAMPHASVETRNFYKLIEQSLPERGRMRHLLIWCATRALLDKPRPAAQTSTIETIAIESARQIQEELIKDFSSKEELSDWWSRPDDDKGDAMQKKANPRNLKNFEKLKELEAEVQRLESEEESWKTILADTSNDGSADAKAVGPSTINTALLAQPQADIYAAIEPSTISSEPLASKMSEISAHLEPKVDALADGVHHLTTYASSAARLADRIKRAWAERLELRDREARVAAGSDAVAGRDVLRALAGRLNAG